MQIHAFLTFYLIFSSSLLVDCGKRSKENKFNQEVRGRSGGRVKDAHLDSTPHGSSSKWKVKTKYYKKPAKPREVESKENTLDSYPHSSYEHLNSDKKNTKQQKNKRPNIVLFLTDDQDVELGSLNFMPKLDKLLKKSGAFFPNAYVSTPMCCPSRSSLLTGLYVHNHRALTNSDNCSSTYWQTEHEPRTFGAYLATGGYRTGYFGKYLNKYNGSYIPPGWRDWAGLVMNSKYYNYTINKNGQKFKHGNDYSKDYYPDLVTNDSIKFIQEWKEEYSSSPMMMVLSFPAPHGPEDSAPQYSDMYFNVTSHRTPSYDFAPNSDKQWVLRWVNKMEPVHHRFTDLLMTKRLQTLQSVDDAVERVLNELERIGELDNTYIFYTSDHGYHLGQFGLVKGKSFPFEFDVRVPFIVRGPGIKPGSTVMNIVGNVDLAPTFLDIAGIPPPSHMDGVSFLRFLRKKTDLPPGQELKRWRDTILLERGKPPPLHLAPLNTLEDVPQLTPVPSDVVPERSHKESEGAEGDDGDDISRDYPKKAPRFEKLAIECQKAQYQSPCELYQKWECIQDGDHWRMRRCPYGFKSFTGCHCVKKKRVPLRRIIEKEKKMQREFLKEHVNRDISKYRPRFLKMNRRTRRGIFDQDPFFLALEQQDVTNPISDIINEGELEEVDLIMEGLNEEISSLQAYEDNNDTISQTTTAASAIYPPCQMVHGRNITCASQVYEDVNHWRESKESIERQIQLLKKQLEEMKQDIMPRVDPTNHAIQRSVVTTLSSVLIRRHLKGIRPPLSRVEPRLSTLVNDSSPEEVFEEYIIDPMGPAEPSPSTHDGSTDEEEDDDDNHDDDEEHTDDDEEDPAHRDLSYDHSRNDESEDGTEDDQRHDVSYRHSAKGHDHKQLDGQNYQQNGISGSNGTQYRSYDGDAGSGKREWSVGFVDLENDPDQFSNGGGIEQYEPEEDHNLTAGKDDEGCICDKRLIKKWRKRQEQLNRAEQRRRKERLKKKQRKLRRKQEREEAGCNLEKMNCFSHDNSHWRTEPRWTDGKFCVCMNANNNTYWCLRTINATHNFLYCEFITGFVTFYDMRIDQYQLRNIAHTLTEDELGFLHSVLVKYRTCGGEECNVNLGNIWRKENAKRSQSLKKDVRYSGSSWNPGSNLTTRKGTGQSSAEVRKKKPLKQWKNHTNDDGSRIDSIAGKI